MDRSVPPRGSGWFIRIADCRMLIDDSNRPYAFRKQQICRITRYRVVVLALSIKAGLEVIPHLPAGELRGNQNEISWARYCCCHLSLNHHGPRGNGERYKLAAVAWSVRPGDLEREKPSLRMESYKEHQVEDSDRGARPFLANSLGQQDIPDDRDRRT